MPSIPLPSRLDIREEDNKKATITISPCYPGYGTTLGNALRRVLLSSMEGAAVKAVKITGVHHEFSTIPHVKEDAVGILLNIKALRMKFTGEEDVIVKLSATGEKSVTVSDIEDHNDVEFADKDQFIATLTDKKAKFEMELTIGRGRGYSPIESRDEEEVALGTIAVDAIYTPVRRVNFRVESARVGQMTNYEKCLVDIETDGTIAPSEAFKKSVGIFLEHFSWLQEEPMQPAGSKEAVVEEAQAEEEAVVEEESEVKEVSEQEKQEK